ncbi:hypothetical protein RY966_003855 [Enterobacter kobei]|nr:hypothetical protein [Enterobacter kobei]
MKKIFTLLAIILSPLTSYAEGADNYHTTLIKAACNEAMGKLEAQYGRRFLCYTDNNIAENLNAALLTTSIDSDKGVAMIRFGDVFYENPNGPIHGPIHYSYNIKDMADATTLIANGRAPSTLEIKRQVCKKGVSDTNENIKKNNQDYLDKKINNKTYEEMNSIFNTVLKNFQRCISDNQ